MLYVIYGNALRKCYAVERREHLAHTDRITGCLNVASVRSGLCNLSGKRCGSHLAARHSVDRVVNEDNGDILTSGSRMNGLTGTDRREVAVALVCEYDILGLCALYAGRNRLSASVRGLYHITCEIIITEYRASYRCNAYCPALDAQFVYCFGNEAVNNTVCTSGAIMKRCIC